MAIIHVTGNPRKGKTSYVVARCMDDYLKYFNDNYFDCCKYITNQNKQYGLTRAFPPQRHVVHGNVIMTRRFPNMSIYPMSGWEFGVPTPLCPAVRPLVPFGVYVFDEAQRYFDSKGESKELPPWVTQAFELHGHIFLTIFLITQRPTRLNVDVRAICEERIHIEKSIHTYKIGKRTVKSDKFLSTGKLVKTEWRGRSFSSEGEHDAYVSGNDKKSKHLGEPYKYVFHGNIKSHYNPYQYAVEMEDLSQDFSYIDLKIKQKPIEWSTYKKESKNGKKVA